MRTVSRGRAGQSFVELAAGLVVLIPIILLVIDLTVCVIAVMVNDSTARDAARAAAAARPVANSFGAADAEACARAVIAKVESKNGYIIGPVPVGDFTVGNEDSGPHFPDGVAADSPPEPDPVTHQSVGGAYRGSYRVTTEVVVKLPASIPNITPSQCTFHSRQEFPITKTEPGSSSPV